MQLKPISRENKILPFSGAAPAVQKFNDHLGLGDHKKHFFLAQSSASQPELFSTPLSMVDCPSASASLYLETNLSILLLNLVARIQHPLPLNTGLETLPLPP